MNVKKNYLLLCICYFLIFFSNALFLSFFQIFLLSKGFGESKIGLISSITPLLCIIVNPLYSLIGKNNKRIRLLLMLLCLLEAIVILLVYKVSDFYLLIVVMCLVAIVDPPLFVILDSYSSLFVKENNMNYSYIRIIGTLAYCIGAFLTGVIVEKSGYDIVFILASLLMIICFIICIFLKSNIQVVERKKGDFILLLKNKNFIIFAIYFIFVLSFAALGDTYISMYLTSEKEVGETTLGIINALWVLIELFVVLLLNKIKIKNDKLLLVIMGLSYMSRLLMIGLNSSLPLLVTSALLRGVGMGINIYLYIPLINKIVKSQNISTSLLLIAMFKSFISTLLISSTGFIVEKIGYSFIFIVWTIVFMIVIFGYYFISNKISKSSFY